MPENSFVSIHYSSLFFSQNMPNSPNSPVDPNHPTKEPFSSAGESKTGGSKTLFGIVAAPFAAVGGLIDQVSRKVTRAADSEEPTPSATPTTKN